MCIMGIETLQCYFQHKRMCNFCCSNTNFVPSKLLLNLQHFYQDFRLSWRSFIGFCVYQVYREHRLSGFPFIRFCVYPIVSFVYPIVSCVYPILSCVYRVLSCIMSRITLRVLYHLLTVSNTHHTDIQILKHGGRINIQSTASLNSFVQITIHGVTPRSHTIKATNTICCVH